MNKKCQTILPAAFVCTKREGGKGEKETFREERAASLWNLLSRLPLGEGGGSASLYLLARRGRTSIIFLAAIVMRLGGNSRRKKGLNVE